MQRDVPGLTRASIPILAAKGVRALSGGVNGEEYTICCVLLHIWIAHCLLLAAAQTERVLAHILVLMRLMFHPIS